MEKLIEKSSKLWHISTIISGVFMAISAALIIVNIILRRFFNAPIFGTTELVQYLGLIVASFAIVQNEWGDGNITMALIVDTLHQKPRYILNAIEFFLEAILFGVIDYLLFSDVLNKFSKGNLTAELRFPKWIPSLIVTIGFVLLTAVLVVKGIVYLKAAKLDKSVNFSEIGRIK